VMTGVLRSRLVVFPQVSAFLPCWAVRWTAVRAEPFARISHASCSLLNPQPRPSGSTLQPLARSTIVHPYYKLSIRGSGGRDSFAAVAVPSRRPPVQPLWPSSRAGRTAPAGSFDRRLTKWRSLHPTEQTGTLPSSKRGLHGQDGRYRVKPCSKVRSAPFLAI
jgi:hypothetical protein